MLLWDTELWLPNQVCIENPKANKGHANGKLNSKINQRKDEEDYIFFGCEIVFGILFQLQDLACPVADIGANEINDKEVVLLVRDPLR